MRCAEPEQLDARIQEVRVQIAATTLVIDQLGAQTDYARGRLAAYDRELDRLLNERESVAA